MARFLILALSAWAAAGCGGNSSDAACRADGECPVHQLCASGICQTGCIADSDCTQALVCNGHGRCVDGEFDASAPNDFAIASNDLLSVAADPDLAAEGDLAPPAGCGDGHLDPGEDCDEGGNNSDDPGRSASCTTHCRKRAACGATAGAEAARVDPDSGHCYIVWPSPLPWASAQSDCQSRGGALAVFDSAGEEALVQSLAGSLPHWVGLRASNSDGDCSWVRAGNTEDAGCGWQATGLLPSVAPTVAGYVCESGCGNGVVESGEECDPPGATCTGTCKTIRACSEGMTSPTTGHCYFSSGPAGDYPTAMTACPAGTHLASLETPDETAVAKKIIGANEVWIGLRAPSMVGKFSWETGEPFFPARYHGFVAGEPNHNSSPTCTRVTSDGWRDQVCNSSYTHLCERE